MDHRGKYVAKIIIILKKKNYIYSVQQVYISELAIFQIPELLNASYCRYSKFYTCVLNDFCQHLHEIMKGKKGFQ